MTQQSTLACTYHHIRRAYGWTIPAHKAIAKARESIAAGKGKTYRPSATGGAGRVFEYAGESVRWIENTSAAGLRFVGYSDDLAEINHTGWFTDSTFEDEKLRGAVYRLPSRKGHTLYVYGYDDPCNKGAALLTCKPEISESMHGDDADTIRDCAKWADSFAERSAEIDRDYNDAWQAAKQWDDLAADMAATRAKARALVSELRAAIKSGLSGSPAICLALRERLRALLDQWESERQERDTIADNFYFWHDGKSMDIAQFAREHI